MWTDSLFPHLDSKAVHYTWGFQHTNIYLNGWAQYVYPFQTHPSFAIMTANKTGAHQTSIYNKSNYTVIVSQHTMKIRLIYEHKVRMTPQTLTPSGYNLEWWPPICKDPVLGRYELFPVFIPLMMFHFMIVCSITVGRDNFRGVCCDLLLHFWNRYLISLYYSVNIHIDSNLCTVFILYRYIETNAY